MDRSKASKRSNGTNNGTTIKPETAESDSENLKMKMVSKTTFKLREDFTGANSEDELELMEIPLSPTHYEQPPTPDHEPPSPFEAETAILKVLDNIRNVSQNHLFCIYI